MIVFDLCKSESGNKWIMPNRQLNSVTVHIRTKHIAEWMTRCGYDYTTTTLTIILNGSPALWSAVRQQFDYYGIKYETINLCS